MTITEIQECFIRDVLAGQRTFDAAARLGKTLKRLGFDSQDRGVILADAFDMVVLRLNAKRVRDEERAEAAQITPADEIWLKDIGVLMPQGEQA